MRVLYVIDSLAPGGAETSLAALAGPLIRRGLELEVVPLLDRSGVETELAVAGATTCTPLGATRRRALAPLRDHIRRAAPDLVHTTLFEADVVGRVAGRLERVPVTSSLVTTGYRPALPSPARTVRYHGALGVDRFTARWVARLHAVSQAAKDTWGPILRVDPSRIDVIHRGRDPERLGRRSVGRTQSVRDRLGIRQGPLVVAVARHDPAKGLDVLVRAWPDVASRWPGATLLLVGGHGSQTSELEEAVETLPAGSVRFLGHRADAPDLIAAADVLAAPSRREGLPGTIIEAMFLETPIVASDIAPVREVLGTDRATSLVPVGDGAALATAISSALAGAQKAETGAGRGRALELFTVERSAERLLEFFQRALATVPP